MDKIAIHNILPLAELKTNTSYITVQALDNIPPHISLISKGKYNSVSAKKVTIGKDASIIISKINRSKIPTLFVALKTTIQDVITSRSFDKIAPLTKGASCLQPILTACKESGIATNESSFIFELIPYLIAIDEVQNIFHLNCESILNNKSLYLNTYGKKEIDQAIINTIQLAKI